MNKKYHMKKEIINRLEYVEETYAGEWRRGMTPLTDTYYHVPIEITRRWDESEALINDKANTMTHERKEEHIRNSHFSISDGASGYVTDNFSYRRLTCTTEDRYYDTAGHIRQAQGTTNL